MQQNYQKIKLLKLLELLRHQTDEAHPMTTRALCAALQDMGIPCERRTLARDIALLDRLGYEIMSATIGHEKAYYVEDRAFSLPELKILIDAVQASNLITPSKAQELIGKLAALSGSHRAEVLTGSVVNFNRRKHTNESVYYNVDTLSEALRRGVKASFLYYSLDENRRHIYHHDGTRCVCEPLSLIYMNDNYYLLSRSDARQSLVNYRLDRMEQVQLEDEPISEETLRLRPDPAEYTEQVFKMFDGSPQEVIIEFDDAVIGAVYDKFGEDVVMKRSGPNTCRVRSVVRLSPTFYGWVFQFGEKMRIVSPSHVRAEFANLAKKAAGIADD